MSKEFEYIFTLNTSLAEALSVIHVPKLVAEPITICGTQNALSEKIGQVQQMIELRLMLAFLGPDDWHGVGHH